jgi:hypothetical protein
VAELGAWDWEISWGLKEKRNLVGAGDTDEGTL